MKNEYEIRGDITAIIIKSPKFGRIETLISTEKLQKVQSFKNSWVPRFCKETQSYYIYGFDNYRNNKKTMIQLHRWILDPPKGMVVDHINRDTLDNTDSNIRTVTHSENMQNRKTHSNNTSGVRGVSWHGKRKKWHTTIRVNNKTMFLGQFLDMEEAEKVVKEARAKYMPFSQEGTHKQKGVIS